MIIHILKLIHGKNLISRIDVFRKKVKKWKSGFYFIAKKAKVPIICVSLNYIDKNVNFSQPFKISGEFEKDLKKFKSFFKGIKGKVAEYS